MNTQELYVGVHPIVKVYVVVFYHIPGTKKRVVFAVYSDERRAGEDPHKKDGSAYLLVVPYLMG